MEAVVLLSGGLDSCTCLALAVRDHGAGNVCALSTFYGQRHERELASAVEVADFYGVGLVPMDVSFAMKYSESPLLTGSPGEIPHSSYGEQLEAMGGEGTVATYVPFRNGLLLSCAAAFAVSRGAKRIIYGAHADDAAGRAYPDCTPEFAEAMGKAVWEGSGRTVRLETPLINMTKAEIVALGISLGAPYRLTWSCYEGGDMPCGACATCIDRAKAFALNGIPDPAVEYCAGRGGSWHEGWSAFGRKLRRERNGH